MDLFKLSKPTPEGLKWVGTFKDWESLFSFRSKVYQGVLMLVEKLEMESYLKELSTPKQ